MPSYRMKGGVRVLKGKFIISLLLVPAMLAAFTGCFEMSYEVIRGDCGDAIKLIRARDTLGQGDTAGEIRFESLPDMKYSIENGELTSQELGIIYRHFPKNDEGLYPIPSLNDLKMPILPERVTVTEGVYLTGHGYVLSLRGDDCYGSISYLYKPYYIARKERMLNQGKDSFHTDEYDPERDARVITYSTTACTIKSVRYTLADSDADLLVIENYYLAKKAGSLIPDDKISADVPHQVILFGEKGGTLFCLSLEGFEARPTLAWLSQFSTTRAVDDV